MNRGQLAWMVAPLLLMASLGCTDEVDQDAIPKGDAALDQKSEAPSDGYADAAVSTDAVATPDAAATTDAAGE